MGRRSKRMLFNNKMRLQRVIDRITRKNSHKPGFYGVATNVVVNGIKIGNCAMFFGSGKIEKPLIDQHAPGDFSWRDVVVSKVSQRSN